MTDVRQIIDAALGIVLALFVLAMLVLSALNSVTALRKGVFTNRNGLQVTRVENPIVFWLSISLGLGVPAAVLCLGLLIAVWLLIAGPG